MRKRNIINYISKTKQKNLKKSTQKEKYMVIYIRTLANN